MGAKIAEPTITPNSVASKPCLRESPKKIGKAPSNTVAKLFAPPKAILKRSIGDDVRSLAGIDSIP